MRIPDELNGKSLADLKLDDFDLRCLGVMRGTDFIGRDGEVCTLEADDMLLILGRRVDLREFTQSI